ncbi:hypothetical protein Glove_151g91 [Diversispora epigaea]|uniref:Protein kinase domain-containing protein n=1 Tax=Diversispora epigaea TaxID=1348612 RepID=A0A397IXS3_9GLOM|nr:hypothetical protein Glove_151g91 [Diversispora epigaea]
MLRVVIFPCVSIHFQNDFNNWASNADLFKLLEWIPYDRLKDVKQIGKGGFGTIHYARWIDGPIGDWDIENKQWKRHAYTKLISVQFFGITQDPETHSYMVNPNNPEKKNIFGVLPYIVPEVLSGDEYTKAADVYSFGIIVYELVTGLPPCPDIPHDRDLAMKICNGLRSKIPFHIPKSIKRTIMRCWDARVTHRPTFLKLYYEFLTNQDYNSRLLNYSNLPKPKNKENFETEL